MDAAKAAAHALQDLVATSGADTYMRDIYGPGAFYTMFEDVVAARRFAAAPRLDDSVLFNDRSRSLLLGDLALGAVSAGFAFPIVVVDVYADQLRCTLRAGSAAHCEHTEIVRVDLPVERLPRPIAPARLAVFERRVVDMMIERSARTDNDDCGYSLYFIGDDDATRDAHEVDIQVVQDVQFGAFLEQLQRIDVDDDDEMALRATSGSSSEVPRSGISGSTSSHARSFGTIVKLWEAHDADTEVVVWVRGDADAQADSMWLIERVWADATTPPDAPVPAALAPQAHDAAGTSPPGAAES